jgi:hypothetical protein
MNATMTRRSFLKAVAAAVVATNVAPTKPVQAQTQRPAWDELPTHPCREIVSQASDASLLEWWGKYGRGTAAPYYRNVPRRHILYVLNQRHIQPFEHEGR